ncbi:MAG: hypothetical protein ACRDOH_04700 [Streptosporangiaceae bacterium]
MAQELGAVVGHRDPGGQGVAGRLGRRDPDDPAEPGRTRPNPAAAHAWPAAASTHVLPDPAGASITETRHPSVSTDKAEAA